MDRTEKLVLGGVALLVLLAALFLYNACSESKERCESAVTGMAIGFAAAFVGSSLGSRR